METPERSSPEQNKAGCEENPTTSTKNKKSKNPRRFTDEQIQSLESIFKLETKPESSKKLQLARDLGLQPRQIAIWFQNRRARWKSRQIEEEYRVLRAKYDSLHLQFDDLKREKQSLQMQLQELSDVVKNIDKVNLADGNTGLKECPNSSNERMELNDVMQTDDEEIITSCFKKLEEEDPLRWGEGGEISHLRSPERWCNLSSCGLLDHWSGTSNSNWWES